MSDAGNLKDVIETLRKIQSFADETNPSAFRVRLRHIDSLATALLQRVATRELANRISKERDHQ